MTTIKSWWTKTTKYLHQAHTAPSNTSYNGKEKTNSDSSEKEIVTNKPIKNTPFRLVGNPKKGYFIALGLHRLTEYKPTQQETLIQLKYNNWELILNMTTTLITQMDEIQKQTKNQ